jgi:superfamily II DNA or RNA helicase
MNPRPYQSDCVNAINSAFKEVTKTLAVVPTGGGKTCIFSWLAAANSGKTLILAHREELIDQAIKKLHAATGIKAEKEKAEAKASLDSQVVVGSIQTLTGDARLERWPANHFSLVIVDEAHHAVSGSYQKILKHFDGTAKVLGVTATPDRNDKKNLGSYFQSVAYEISLFDLINANYLSRIQVKSIPLAIDLNSVRSTMGDLNETDLGEALEPYLGEIAKSIAEHAAFRRVLAFLPLRATSRKFVAACEDAGLSAMHVDGESEDRAEILERFSRREFDVLSNAMLLTEGYDDPGIDCVVVLRPTRSRPLHCQMVGRGTRISPHKQNLLLLDFLWAHERHSLCRPAHLIASTDEEADAITELAQERSDAKAYGDELDLGALAGDAVAKREEALRKRLAEAAKKKAKFISAEEFAMKHDSFETAEFEPTMEWEMRPPTDKQLIYIKRAGIDPASVRGSVHASKLLSLHFRDQGVKLASPSAAAKIRAMPWIAEQAGITDMKTITAQQAGRFFATLKNSR